MDATTLLESSTSTNDAELERELRILIQDYREPHSVAFSAEIEMLLTVAKLEHAHLYEHELPTNDVLIAEHVPREKVFRSACLQVANCKSAMQVWTAIVSSDVHRQLLRCHDVNAEFCLRVSTTAYSKTVGVAWVVLGVVYRPLK